MRLTHFICFALAVALHVFAAVRFVDLDSVLKPQEPTEELSLTMEWVEKARELLETQETNEPPPEPEEPEQKPPEPQDEELPPEAPEQLPPPPTQDRSEEAPPPDQATQAAAAGGGTPEPTRPPEPIEQPAPEPERAPEPAQPEPSPPAPTPEPEPPAPQPEKIDPTPAPQPRDPKPAEPVEPQPEAPLERITQPEPAPQPVGPHFAPAGPGDSVSNLPLPRHVFDGPPQARLVHDFSGSFRDNLQRLGGTVLLYPKSRDPRYFLELAPGASSRTRRIGRSTTEGNALARRLSGATGIDLSTSARFEPTRIEISRSIGLGRDKLQMIAIVSDSIRARMESQKNAAMEQFGLDHESTRAVFGRLTGDPAAPLRVTGYLDASGRRFALRNDSE